MNEEAIDRVGPKHHKKNPSVGFTLYNSQSAYPLRFLRSGHKYDDVTEVVDST
jgi:hypothetical protein